MAFPRIYSHKTANGLRRVPLAVMCRTADRRLCSLNVGGDFVQGNVKGSKRGDLPCIYGKMRNGLQQAPLTGMNHTGLCFYFRVLVETL
jgi:hypothetical protein